MRRVRSAYEVRGTRWEKRDDANYESSRLFIKIGRPGAELSREYTLAVTALGDLPQVGVTFAATDRAHLVTTDLDQERVRQYVTKMVQNCPDLPESQAHAVFERYFDVAGSPPPRSSSKRIKVRGFDPPWQQSDDDLTLTFGVAERAGVPDAELGVSAVTPKGLVARAHQDGFILCHRATILTASIDVHSIQQHIVNTVSSCSGPDLSVALQSLQRYYALSWETSLTRGVEV